MRNYGSIRNASSQDLSKNMFLKRKRNDLFVLYKKVYDSFL